MYFMEYVKLALRTAKPMTQKGAMSHAAMGLSSESGELITTIKAHVIYDKPLDIDNLVEECGDALWFAVYFVEVWGLSMNEIEQSLTKCEDISFLDSGRYRTLLGHLALRLSIVAGELNDTTAKALDVNGYNTRSFVGYVERTLCEFLYILQHISKGSLLTHCAPKNIEKLRKRYPDKYSDADAIARADKA